MTSEGKQPITGDLAGEQGAGGLNVAQQHCNAWTMGCFRVGNDGKAPACTDWFCPSRLRAEERKKFTESFLSKDDAKTIVCGLIPDGLSVAHLTAKARKEIRAALDLVLERRTPSK